MNDSIWEEAVTALERASARLIAAMPDNTPLIEDALERRLAAIERIRAMTAPPGEAMFLRLQEAAQIGDKVREQLLLQREQLRDSISRINHSTYLTQAFAGKATGKSEESRKVFDCAG